MLKIYQRNLKGLPAVDPASLLPDEVGVRTNTPASTHRNVKMNVQ